jgi:hypothetical protein
MIGEMEQPITIGADKETFIGKRLLVGVRWTSRGEVVREEQFHGLIVDADQGINPPPNLVIVLRA